MSVNGIAGGDVSRGLSINRQFPTLAKGDTANKLSRPNGLTALQQRAPTTDKTQVPSLAEKALAYLASRLQLRSVKKTGRINREQQRMDVLRKKEESTRSESKRLNPAP